MKEVALQSFTLDDWPVLGNQISISLVNHMGVLVGRNGAGKSAILEGFSTISSWVAGRYIKLRPFEQDSFPKKLKIQIQTPTQRQLSFTYELLVIVDSEDKNIEELNNDPLDELGLLTSWNDKCQYLDGEKEVIWETREGSTQLMNESGEKVNYILGATSALGPSFLQSREKSNFLLPEEMEWVRSTLRGVRLLGRQPIRQRLRRRASTLEISNKRLYSPPRGLADYISSQIIQRMTSEEVSELEEICKRIGLGKKITLQKFILDDSETYNISSSKDYISSVLLDDTNLGFLSDGTLRILSILVELLKPNKNSTTIIEEPEANIHPGMLEKLLNEISAYTYGKSLILSTHSPQVLAWTDPEKISLISRASGKTSVRKLLKEEIAQATQYLHEEGDLGDWIYSGMLDDDNE